MCAVPERRRLFNCIGQWFIANHIEPSVQEYFCSWIMHVIWGCYHNGVNAVVTLCYPLGLLLKRRMRSSGSMNVVRERLQDLRARGANVALDDFGVEQSNLSRLLELNVDYIKLDRSLTQSLNQNAKANSIVQSTSQLRASLGIEIIAKGIETSSQSQILLNYGISKQQGFLFRH